MVDRSLCPCISKKNYAECCKNFHLGLSKASSAEELMRSRYSAYVKKMKNYLLDTWHPSTRPTEEELKLDESGFKWLNLSIRSSQENASIGLVSFTASYCFGTQKGEMKEVSKFIKEDGTWYYLDAA